MLLEYKSKQKTTGNGTPYLTEPGVSLAAHSVFNPQAMSSFLGTWDDSLAFQRYQEDEWDKLTNGVALSKFAGQVCYASFGERRTKNREAENYINHIKESGHGSVFEHQCYTFLIYGISRSLSHELVRHRAGTGFSQLSQRYVSGRVLRFVERPEYQGNDFLHSRFENRIDRAREEYEEITDSLLGLQKSGEWDILSADAKTDLRKKVQQTARSVLPNETETIMVMTGNARAWRHILEMRAHPGAEIEIRKLAMRVYQILYSVDPILFNDYQVVELKDGTQVLETPFRKV